MAYDYFNPGTLRFFLFDVHGADGLLAAGRYSHFDREAIGMLLDTLTDFSDRELYPYLREMDREPAYYRDGKIFVHPQFEKIFRMAGELGLIGASFDEEKGGMQLPSLVVNALYFIMEAANNHVTGYLGLTAGAANLILSFGNDELKKKYVPPMLSMEWGGTMCLTEPQAGSSLSDITTMAHPTESGHYLLRGQKVFISAGDHPYAENFVHLVLARLPDAPAGTKGISLFVVPKYRPDDTGRMEDNHVTVAGEFDKLGQRGYCTTHLVFGETGDCHGWLLGEAHQGLGYMFQLMNEARIATGRMGLGIASAAYYASLRYARERPQGRKLPTAGTKEIGAPQTPIVNHPDIRRMLLSQKAIVEGSLSLVLQTSYYVDKTRIATGTEKDNYELLLELLTPVVKTYPAEAGFQAVNQGLQILGGYGYMQDFELQQYLRDMRIISIYEGTTGIQSLDLLGRKMTMKNGAAFKALAREIQTVMEMAHGYDDLRVYAGQLGETLQATQQVLQTLLPHLLAGDQERYLADATVFMEMFGLLVVGWQWLKTGVTAKKGGSFEPDFYEAKLHTLKYFFHYELTKTTGLTAILLNREGLTLSSQPDYFD
ncbi:MAG: acyl-CoA dehydrogenase [Cyclobacteriaceae bacterium]|nr:acyl-CoA dehydrogenase [Cyclobacteriaceae bacterium]